VAVAGIAAQPNVILIVADDLGWNDVGYHGSELRTPNIDRLAQRGVVLDHFYAYPMCNPTRMALMTGRAAAPMIASGPRQVLPPDERILPQIFREAGYQTFMVGKWHLGARRVSQFPHRRGFDRFYGFLNSGIDYYTHIHQGGLDWQRNGESVREEGYSTELLTDEAIRQIAERDPDRPTLLYVCYNAVHTPLQVPDSWTEPFASLEGDRRIYAGMTAAMDAGVGRILAALDKEMMTDESIILFMSDNGGGRAADNSPLRGGKTSTFEGGIRVPAILWQPGVLEGGEVSRQVVTVHDWLPTLATGAGVPLGETKPLYGKDLWETLVNGETAPNDEFIIAHRGNIAVFDGEWKYVWSSDRQREARPMLFRISEDPFEKNDLAADHPDILERLRARAAEVPTAAGPPGGRRPAGAKPRPGQRGGGRQGDQFAPQMEETREPWAESAAQN
jgi:arylsulfatase A-like enzyme